LGERGGKLYRLSTVRCVGALSLALVVAPSACYDDRILGEVAEPAGNLPRGGDAGVELPDAGPSDAPPPGPTEGGQACVPEVHQAQRLPVDLLVVLDSSSSMEEMVPGDLRTKGELVTDALTSFVKDPASAGLAVGLQLFPGTGRTVQPPSTPASCQSDMECAPNLVCRLARECLSRGQASGRPCPEDQFTGPNQRCPGADGMCVDAARCAVSQLPCYPPGQPCPSGRVGDVCQPAARRCLEPSGGLLCQPSTYEKLVAPIAELPGAEAPLARALESVAYTSGMPMGPAVAGALAHARAHQAANPTHRVAMVLASGGVPDLCLPQDDAGIAAPVAAAAMGAPPISTYAIGVFATSLEVAEGGAVLDKVATAGGTGKAFVLNSDPILARTFLDALEKIRQATLPCAFLIPRPNGPIDFGKVNVRLQDAAGTTQEIPYVTAVNRCDPMQGGWYYDVDPALAAPTTVVTCPASCDRSKARSNATVSLVFGCKTRVRE
jgi:hypothetical protein